MNLSYKKGINIITMKIALYFSALAVLLGACSSSQNFTLAQEDDIYYVPGKRSLFAQEVKDKTGVDIISNTSSSSQISKNTTNDKVYPKEIDNSVNPKSYSIGMEPKNRCKKKRPEPDKRLTELQSRPMTGTGSEALKAVKMIWKNVRGS